MNEFEIAMAVLGLINVAGVGGLWFRLGRALESNENVHTRLDSLTSRVRALEVQR